MLNVVMLNVVRISGMDPFRMVKENFQKLIGHLKITNCFINLG